MHLLSIAAGVAGSAAAATQATAENGLVINWFWILVSTANFLFFFFILYKFAFGPLNRILEERRKRVEDGLKDAEQARLDRESAESDRAAALQEARREANEILARSQKVAEESRERDLAATREELERIRVRASAELESEKQRAIADLRAEVADLALRAAGKVVGETMNDDRQRRLVQDFLTESGTAPNAARERNG
jgi:F-type H+-transporting ATPase subunit b